MALRRRNNVILYADNAIIEEIFTDNRTSYVTISYGVIGDFNITHMQVVTLIVNRDTTIRDQFGRCLSLRELKEGMIVDAEFSSNMTRSIPPQARAYKITVVSQNSNSNVKIDTVIDVEPNFGFLYTGNPNDIYSQMRFVINDSTIITNRRGNVIDFESIRPGDTVKVEHANFQTMSIPPQTTAFSVEVL